MTRQLTYKEYVREFLQFLKENNVYNAYKQNVLADIEMYGYGKITLYDRINPLPRIFNKFSYLDKGPKSTTEILKQIINFSFMWCETKEGEEYWRHLDNLWKDKTKNYIIT